MKEEGRRRREEEEEYNIHHFIFHAEVVHKS